MRTQTPKRGTSITMRLPIDLKARIARAATEAHRKPSAWCRLQLALILDQKERKQ
jgi:hypothetical protein